MEKPNFFIVGAPKCGTTALSQWLSKHPQVYFSPRKEPHFFNTDGLTATSSLLEYESLFSGATSEHNAVGEGSTHYLYSNVAIKNILEYQPKARFIVCLRNPIDMAPSLHAERLSQGRENERDFVKAWRLQSLRAAGQRIPKLMIKDPERLQYGAYCKLGEQIERLYKLVPDSKVLLVLLDDVKKQPELEYARVLDFLDLSEMEPGFEFEAVNPSKYTRSPALSQVARALSAFKRTIGMRRSMGIVKFLKEKNIEEKPRKPLSKEMHHELKEYFKEDIALMSNILARDLSEWLK